MGELETFYFDFSFFHEMHSVSLRSTTTVTFSNKVFFLVIVS